MKSIKRLAKRTLSLVLCLAMVMTTMFFFDIGITKPEAVVPAKGRVAFYVPEVIYLYPDSYSDWNNVSTPFQYYVENTVNTSNIFAQPTVNQELKSVGNIYFSVEGGFGEEEISFRFMNENFETLSGGNVDKTNLSRSGNYAHSTINGGTSPSLAPETSGCYIEWTVSYTNEANERLSAIAYTYVYKPYIHPVAAGVNAGTGSSSGANWACHITWISGIHSITKVASNVTYDNFTDTWVDVYTRYSIFATFISKDNVAYVNGTKYTNGAQAKITSGFSVSPSSSGGSLGYAVFRNTPTYYLEDSNNQGAAHFGASDPGSGANTPHSGLNNFTVTEKRANERDIQCTSYERSYGNLYVDTSRYSNLNQIPNLAVGMIVTSDQRCEDDTGRWYVANYSKSGSEYDYYLNKWFKGGDNATTLWNDKGSIIASQGTKDDDRRFDTNEGIRYAGAWPKALNNLTSTTGATEVHRVKGYYANTDGSYDAQGHTVCELKTTYYNKSTLRTAVFNALQEFNTLGVKDNFDSYRYDTNSAAWTKFVQAYKEVSKALTRLDSSCSYAYITNLQQAISDLKNGANRKIFFNINHDGIKPNEYILGTATTGGYGLSSTYDYTKEYITLNGTITGSNELGKTPFTPKVGSYTFSAFKDSGSVSGNGCVVLDASKNDGSNVSERTNFDFTGGTYSYKSFTAATAGETDFLRFWQWKNTDNTVYSNFKFRIKVEEGSGQTAYSPAARFATSGGTYGELPVPDKREGFVFLGWFTDAACTKKAVATTAVSSDVLYAGWGDAEVIFGNDFDFDRFDWVTASNGTSSADFANNILTLETRALTATEQANNQYTVDAYTTNYDHSQSGYMTLVPGRVYEFSCTVKNNTAKEIAANMFLFTFSSNPNTYPGPGLGSDQMDFTSAGVYVGANETDMIRGTLTIPEGRPYATIRIGSYTPSASMEFSNITVRDISSFYDWSRADANITFPDPRFKNSTHTNPIVTGFPSISRDGYVFAGWSEVRADNGNGKIENKVESVDLTGGNKILYPIWQTNITYNTAGGVYRQTSENYCAENRLNLAFDQNIAVSNKYKYNVDASSLNANWNNTALEHSFVPYKPGYNFKGWKATSIDPNVNGKTYWPGNTVSSNASVAFTAQWEAATQADTTAQTLSASANGNNAVIYPGQMHFFKFTPQDRGTYISAYTQNANGQDMEMYMYDANLANPVYNNDNTNDYGLYNDTSVTFSQTDPMITTAIDRGSSRYYGVSLLNVTGYAKDPVEFKLTEHTVEYSFEILEVDKGATVDGSTTLPNITGYGNTDTALPTNGVYYGYTFNGWKTDGESPEKHYAMNGSTCTVPGSENTYWLQNYTEGFNKTINLVAQWGANGFTIKYEGNPGSASTDGTLNMNGASTSTWYYDASASVTTAIPTMDGYTFKGWATTSTEVNGETLYNDQDNGGANKDLSVEAVNNFYRSTNGGEITLYARWAPNFIIVRFKPSDGSSEGFAVEFLFDQAQYVGPQTIPAGTFTVNFYDGTGENIILRDSRPAYLVFEGWQDVPVPGTPKYTYASGVQILNPNGVTGTSDKEATYTDLYAVWRGGDGTTPVDVPLWTDDDAAEGENPDVLVGFAKTPDATVDDIDYEAGSKFIPTEDLDLYAVWYSPDEANKKMENYKQYEGETEVVTGVEFTNADLTEATVLKEEEKVPIYNTETYRRAVQILEKATAALKNSPTAENNKKYYNALKTVEGVSKPQALKPVADYITAFEIKYASGVTGKVPAGTYSLADMNLNHYADGTLKDAKTAQTAAKNVVSRVKQADINDNIVAMAKAFANKVDISTTPTYQVYETAEAIKNSLLDQSEGITAVNYVYTGKSSYTYYCYTNSPTPKVYLTVEDESSSDGRYCYPTTFDTVATKVATSEGVEVSTPKPSATTVTNEAVLNRYKDYLEADLGTKYDAELGADYYSQKAVIKLDPDFTNAASKSTATYILSAYDDSFAGLDEKDKNYADSAKLSATLASGQRVGTLPDIPNTDNARTPENTISIIINYHNPGDSFNVRGDQVQEDVWLKQYHLIRASAGASNWELPMPGDSVYTVDDKNYGQKDYGAFTYTFTVGATTDFENCTLAVENPIDNVAAVREIIANNYSSISSKRFTNSKATTRFAHKKDAEGNDILNENGKPIVYIETVPAGTGLGYKAWSNTVWSFNYYPQSRAYTYVHIVDRWGNTVDKVIQVPDIDATAVTFLTQDAGDLAAVEAGGSGINTMSFSAKSFDIIPDENSIFDGETYTTEGNTIKVYTGEANKKYTFTANDFAANSATGEATTDADGYLTITVEDDAFDTQSGAYTFTLNGIEINLYADVEKNIVSAEDVSVEEGQTATVEIVTNDKVTSVQLVSPESGSTTTATTYTEDGDGNRVWQINKKKTAGKYEYKVRYKTGGGWLTEGDVVAVTVTKPILFVGEVTSVEYTPSTETRNEFLFTVTGRPDKVRVIEPDGGTRTYDRYHAKVVIVSYDAEGNVIGSMSRDLSYEIWTIDMTVPANIELTAVAKYGRTWSSEAPYKYTVVLATPEFDDKIYEMKLDAPEGEQGKVGATVVTGLDVSGVRFIMDNNTTATYYNATEADNRLTYRGAVWINHKGENIIVVKIRVNNAWLNAGQLDYYGI
ncbi:MAG: InlB B-repeat-containing protein [Clostridia bacterium]|nr:InlB B-repeat-containing protein [Clostridia bacterium]